MTYLVYSRISPRGSDYDKAQETSCAVQDEQTRAHVLRLDPSAKFAPSVRDEFASGGNNRRDGLRSILSDVSEGRATWDTLAVWDIDRLSGSQEGFSEITSVLNKGGKGLVVARQNLDFATLHGRMLMGIMVVIKEYFNGMGAEKTRDKMKWMAEHGRYVVGWIPTGYIGRKADKAAGTPAGLVIDPVKGPMVQELFKRYAAGEGPAAIRKWWPLPHQTILRILRSQVYIGKVPWDGQWFQGKHEPLVSPELFAAVQARIPVSNYSPRPSLHAYDYMLVGLVRCSCGKSMTAMTRRRGGATYPYYRCPDSNCQHRSDYVRADDLEGAITKQMSDLWRNPKLLKKATEAMRSAMASSSSETTKALTVKKAELEKVVAAIAEIKKNLTAPALGPSAARLLSEAADDAVARRDALTPEINALEAKASVEQQGLLAMDTVERQFRRMSAAVAEGDDNPAIVRRALRAWVNCVIRKPDGAFEAKYNFIEGVPTTARNWHPSQCVVGIPVLTPKEGVKHHRPRRYDDAK